MPPVGFEPTISAGERPQTYALDRAANGDRQLVQLVGFIIRKIPKKSCVYTTIILLPLYAKFIWKFVSLIIIFFTFEPKHDAVLHVRFVVIDGCCTYCCVSL